MQIAANQLTHHLQKTLAPVYLVSGDVPLLMQEAAEQIKQAAQKLGFTERVVLHVDAQFNWPHFLADTENLSLFTQKKTF